MGPERRGRAVHGRVEVNPSGEEPTDRPRQKNAELWEPYDGRLSRTVLREREGRFPPATHHRQRRPGRVRGRDHAPRIWIVGHGCQCGAAVWQDPGRCEAITPPIRAVLRNQPYQQ